MTQKCSERVWKDDWHQGQCDRPAVMERDGKWYCSIHNPEYIEKKEANK